MIKKELIVLFFIIVIAATLRLWQLGNVPASPDWDEAALGYNAYSIMKTGRDEYGKLLPIVLRSFDDYKPALYAYLTIPSVLILGLNTFAVRLPSALMGILTVIATYFLIKELFKMWEVGNEKLDAEVGSGKSKIQEISLPNPASHIALLTSFLLAISPWHLQFSRIAFEANIGLTLNIFSILCFLWSLRKPWLLIASAIFASLSLYAYQSEKIFVPLMAMAIIVIYRKELMQVSKKWLLLTMITGLFIALPMIFYLLTDKNALIRAKGVSAFADQTRFLQKSSQRLVWDKENNDRLGWILDNRRIQYVQVGISGYLAHFDFNWLFIHGDEPRHHAPDMGLLYLWELPLVLIGLYLLVFSEFSRKTKLLIFSWFLIAPIPASITSGVPHAVRTLNFLPTFQIFGAVGVLETWRWLRNRHSGLFRIPFGKLRTSRFWSRFAPQNDVFIHIVFPFFLFSLFTFNFLYYLNQYFVQQNYYNSQSWQYGYREIVSEVKKKENQYDKIVVSNRPYMDQSYMFFLYYLKYDPLSYQKESQKSSGGFKENHFFGKFEFRPIDWEKEDKKGKILYVGRFSDFPENVKALQSVYFLDGKPAIKVVKR